MLRSILQKTLIALLLAPLFAPATPAPAFSDWIAVYAVIDKVVLEPSESAPERIQLWGDFAIARTTDRNTYEPAARGYLYYAITPGKEDVCRKEWADLKRLSGTGQVVGFGARNRLQTRLRAPDAKPADPDPYPVASGLVRMSDRPSNYEPIRELKAIARPQGNR